MESEIFKKGIAKRRKVLGDAYVDKALASADVMGADMQKLVTEYAWGEVWNKENLSDRDRSLVNLGMIAALNRSHEFKIHVRAFFLFWSYVCKLRYNSSNLYCCFLNC